MNYFKKHILTPIFTEEIPFPYPNKLHCVKYYQDKAPNNTSKSIDIFFEKMRNETEIEVIPFKCILLKSPDLSPMDLLCSWTF